MSALRWLTAQFSEGGHSKIQEGGKETTPTDHDATGNQREEGGAARVDACLELAIHIALVDPGGRVDREGVVRPQRRVRRDRSL